MVRKSNSDEKLNVEEYPAGTLGVLATVGFVKEVKNELLARIDEVSLGHESRFDEISSKFSSMHSRFSKIDRELFQLKALIEEQNARNIYVLDGFKVLFDRQERIEEKLDEVIGN